MKNFFGLIAVAYLCLSIVSSRADANLFADPSFEAPVTHDGPPFVGSWEAFNGADATSDNGTIMPRSGLLHLDMNITGVDTFAGVFQDIPGLSAGQPVTFSGWHKLASGNSGGTEIRIEWRDSVNDVEITRTPNLVLPTTADYEEFSLSAAVPAGADTARAVYAIQSFGAPQPQNVYLDDLSFVIPEPTTVVLLGSMGIVTLLRRRRGL